VDERALKRQPTPILVPFSWSLIGSTYCAGGWGSVEPTVDGGPVSGLAPAIRTLTTQAADQRESCRGADGCASAMSFATLCNPPSGWSFAWLTGLDIDSVIACVKAGACGKQLAPEFDRINSAAKGPAERRYRS
jgi:hypothetical protein